MVDGSLLTLRNKQKSFEARPGVIILSKEIALFHLNDSLRLEIDTKINKS